MSTLLQKRLSLLLVLFLALTGAAPETRPGATAAVVTLRGEVDDYTRDSLIRQFAAARKAGATTIILDLDTPGGLVTSGLDITRFIRGQNDLTVIAYVEKAYSAGAMIAVSCNQIVMAPSAVVGDCAPIVFKTDGGLDAMPPAERAKAQSPILADFDASADRNGYDRLLLEAMVITERVVYWVENPKTHARQFTDQAGYDKLTSAAGGGWVPVVGVPCPVDGAETLLTVNTDEAIKLGLAKSIAPSPQAVAEARHEPVVADLTPGAGEKIIEFLNYAAVRAFLFTVLSISLYVVLGAPGHGLAEACAIISLGLLLGVPLLTGYAEWWEVVVIFVGLALLAFEIFVFPGHGVSAIVGIVMILGGILSTFVAGVPGSVWPQTAQTWSQVRTGSAVVTGGLATSLVLCFWLRSFLPKLPYFSRLILNTTSGDVPQHGSAEVAPENRWPGIGITGVAVTDLRPGGSAEFPDVGLNDVRTVGVVSETGYISAGTSLVVRESRGNHVVVRAVS